MICSKLSRVLVAAGMATSIAGVASAQYQVIVRQFDPDGAATSASTKVPGLPSDQSAPARNWQTSAFWSVDITAGQATAYSTVVPSIDNSGNVAFYGSIAPIAGVITNGSSSLPSNQDALFFATPANGYDFTGKNNIIVVRDGSAAGASPAEGGPTPTGPGLPANVSLNNAATGRSGLSAGASMSSNGQIVGAGLLFGAGLTQNANNNVLFTGTNTGGTVVTARRSDTAPGTGGNTFGGASSGANLAFNYQPVGGGFGGNSGAANPIVVNNSGQTVVLNQLATGSGPTIVTSGGGQNDTGVFITGPSGAAKVYRRNEFVSGSSGLVFGAPATSNNREINRSGDVLFGNSLSTNTTLAGAALASSTTNQAFFLYSGGANTMLARAGDAVGGSSYLSTATYVAASSQVNGAPGGLIPALSHQALNNSKRVLFDASFTPGTGGIASTADSEALLTWTPAGGAQPIFRTASDPVPGVPGATFSTFKPNLAANPSRLNNLNHVAVNAVMTTDNINVTAATNQGLWLTSDLSSPGTSSTLIARSGQDVSALFGLSAGSIALGPGALSNIILAGNSDIVVFQDVLSDTRVATFGWTPTDGLIKIAVSQPNATGALGDTGILGASYPLSSVTYNCVGNGDGGVQSLNDNGLFTFLAMSGGAQPPTNSAIVVFQVPAPGFGGVGFAALGFAALRRRR